jgi:ferric-dicitrate binding protein FerR (iron transport regulator)
MDINKIWDLVTGESREAEKQQVLAEIESDQEARKAYNELKNTWALLSSTRQMSEVEVNDMYKRFRKQNKLISSSTRFRAIDLLKYAAVFAFGILIAYAANYFLSLKNTADHLNVLNTTVIGEKDQISKILLPDSSVVWVNSRSKIVYNNKFGLDNRDIKLEGQAYFQAAKNKSLPLVVKANGLEVRVLGTKFDVSAYPEDKNVKIVLESGKVELEQLNGNAEHCELAPGEMATCNVASNKITINKVETRLYTAWKDGLMIFRDDPMAVVISQLERRFNIDVVVKDREIYKSVFTATINNEPLDKILKAMEFSCSMKATLVRDSSGIQRLKVILSKSK